VDAVALGRFLPSWQHIDEPMRGVDGLAAVIDQLAGVALPASSWESLVLPARVKDYSPVMLDELTATGEIIWSGGGALPGNDGWVSLHLAESASLTLPEPTGAETTELQRSILASLTGGGAYFFRQLSNAVGSTDDKGLLTALWDLVWSGLVTNDTLSPLRSYLGTTTTKARVVPRSRAYRGRARPTMPSAGGPPSAAGRWSLLPLAEPDATVRGVATAELLLERYGVVTRGAVVSEGIRGGFSLVYRVLSGFEETGRARRGYFVEGLGAAQFATGATVDRLRSFVREPDAERPPVAIALAATDPANAYGAALAWPASTVAEGDVDSKRGHRPGRKAGALVVIVDGALALYVERGGKTMLTFAENDRAMTAAAHSLATVIRRSGGRLKVERVNGDFVIGTALGDALVEAGFTTTPQGLRLRG
jgi:ATP-dependent Lhr-like helicase